MTGIGAIHVCFIYVFITKFQVTTATVSRAFPRAYNLAAHRPVTSSPADSTCGVPTRNAYCESSIYPISVQQCTQLFCVEICPNRTALPAFTDLLISTSPGLGECVVTDTINIHPGSKSGEFSTYFVKPGPSCYVTPSSQVQVGGGGDFTLTVWIWQDTNNNGTIFQKVTENGEVILELLLANSKVSLVYRGSSGISVVTFQEKIPSKIWNHIVIQTYQKTLSFYVNGVKPGYLPVETVTLKSAIKDSIKGRTRIGQSLTGGNQFLGRIQDFRFFTETLTNREIQEVYTDTLPWLRVQTECRCPASHPRLKPLMEHYCIENGVGESNNNGILRLNIEAHNLEFVNDGDSNTFWISKFQNEVELTIDLGDAFQVFFVSLQFYSPLPKAVLFSRQKYGSSSWEDWQMYATDCMLFFKQMNNGPLPRPDSVNCLQFGMGSKHVPYSKGNITFSLLSSEPVVRPGYNDFYNTPELKQFVIAQKVRVKFLEHHYVTNLRHQYFGVYEYIISGRCNCHGHAHECDTSTLPYNCSCIPDSFTQGSKCEECQPLYNNKPYREGDQINHYNCKPCECHNHSNSCVYNASLDLFQNDHDLGGGGVCIDCQHNTAGRFCETCVELYYRPLGKSKYDEDVCVLCDCNVAGVASGALDCQKDGGQCSCKNNVGGRQCDKCLPGFYNLQSSNPEGCDNCSCNIQGTVNGDITCDSKTGTCHCKQNVRNAKCDACKYGYYNLSGDNLTGCKPCECNPQGSTSQFCDPITGQCQCKDRVTGRRCDQCIDNYQDFISGCSPCVCNILGTVPGTVCDKVSGQCVCKKNVRGKLCDECEDGSFGFGGDSVKGCYDCSCNLAGTVNSSIVCEKVTGSCLCKDNVEGMNCNQCKRNTYGLNISNPDGCLPCNCDVTGTVGGEKNQSQDLSCDQNTGACTCLAYRVGRRCDDCQPGRFVKDEPGGGCEACGCSYFSTHPQTYCDTKTGQCQCKGGKSGVVGRTCEDCREGYFNFNRYSGNCSACDCDKAGSLNATCNAVSGQCFCKEFVVSRRCDRCASGSSFLDPDNPYGCSKEPTQQPPPEHAQNSSTQLWLRWIEPDYPNGVISQYRLFRNGTLIFTGNASEMSFQDSGLAPYTRYTYIVEATNGFGSTQSRPVTFITLPGAPTGIVYVTVSEIKSRSARFAWIFPAKLNGPLANFSLVTVKPSQPSVRQVHWTGIDNKTQVFSFIPFTNYTVYIETCSKGGCLDSWPLVFSTKSALPTGMEQPNITTVSSTELNITWKPPAQANGIIIFYELWIRGHLKSDGTRDPLEKRIFHPSGQYNPRPTLSPQENPLPPPETHFLVKDLQPYTFYEFQVLAENDIGKTASMWTSARTGEAPPLSTPTPDVYSVSNSILELQWEAPSYSESRGVITKFHVYFYTENDANVNPHAPPYMWKLVSVSGGSFRSHRIGGLQPYTNYTFMLGACNAEGCVNSSHTYGTTDEAVPRGLKKPKLFSYNSSMIRLSWEQPEELNGPLPLYSIEKTVPSLSYPPRVVQGTRFPGGGYYLFPPDIIPPNVAFTGIRLKFKTRQRNGLLLFAASAGRQDEFIALQFKAGRPWFLFDPQDCPSYVEINPKVDNDRIYNDDKWHTLIAIRDNELSRIQIDEQYQGCPSFVNPTNDEGLLYNDYRWHELLATRDERRAYISLDNVWKGVRESSCSYGTVIGPSTGVYVGGLPSDFSIRRKDIDSRMKVTEQSFQGCIKDIQILQQMYPKERWRTLEWSKAKANELAFLNWEGCPVNLQSGVHFMGQGYLTLPASRWNMITKTILEFQFRTDLSNGLIFFAHGGVGIYYYIGLINGRLHFEFSNGISSGGVMFHRPSVNLCDSNWYSVRIIKDNQMATIILIGYGSETAGNASHRLLLQTSSDIYMGGIPPSSTALEFIRTHNLNVPLQGFGGCISYMKVTIFTPVYYSYLLNIVEYVQELANVNMDGCTPFNIPSSICKEDIVGNIYNGTDPEYIDSDLQPYSDYLYRVLASNNAGTGFSPWVYGKTKEGAPIGVKAPYNVKVLSGFEIQASWYPPESSAGLLSQYILRAYSLDIPHSSPVEAVFTNTGIYTGIISKVIPNTNYTVKIAICSGGGCTESTDGVSVVTFQEAPGDVPAPTAESGTSFIHVMWKPPGMPNGNITGYVLYKDGVEIYSGGGRSYNITGLQVYTGYQFVLKACTKIGCTEGPTTTLSTAQLAPSFVAAPSVKALGNTRVEARWAEPVQLNGVLQRYLLYLSTDNDTLGSIVYNNSDLFLDYIIPDLTAGTTYHIRVAACTLGGCKHSDSREVTTEESAPEEVPDPKITSPSPQSLLVTWDVPSLPNGHIIAYNLYHNEVKVYSGLTRSYVIDGLTPYSLHTMRVSACTVRGCGSSQMVKNRTQEAPPTGFIVMKSEVLDARTIRVTWNPPDEANGVMYYDIYVEGQFFADRDNDNYTMVNERRSLFRGQNVSEWIQVWPLIPMSQFTVQVNASNKAGYLLSNTMTADMPEGTPDGVLPPSLVSETPTSITATWTPVGRGNAKEGPMYVLQFRDLVFNGTTVYDIFGPTTTYIHTKQDLIPYTVYEFRVVASNSHGSTRSSWAKHLTKQDRPKSLDPPIISAVGSRYLDLIWQKPPVPNGVVHEYRIYKNNMNLVVKTNGSMTYYRAKDLDPFTLYIFVVEACTLGGCQQSRPSASIRTLEDSPEGLLPPTVSSLTPTSVQVEWNQPERPNGLINHYTIERQINSTNNITRVTKVLPVNDLKFVDEMSDLSPFTVYDYRIVVYNGAGSLASEWSTVVTKSSRPTGVMPPEVKVTSAFSLSVKWESPRKPNGLLEYYMIHLNQQKQEIRNVTIRSYTFTKLQPYTKYSVKLTICSDGGCSESSVVDVSTLPTIPEGQAAPVPTPISQNLITISWNPPVKTNGPNVRYELIRKTIRQPLEVGSNVSSTWRSLYSGTSLYHEDRGLSLFTTYVYKITVYNDVGQLTSPESREATTFGGFPRKAAIIHVLPIDHLTLQVTWITPSLLDLQGSVTEFIIRGFSSVQNVTETYDPGTSNVLIKNLHPNTHYTVELTITVHGGQTITSDSVSATTLDGAPVGMPLPSATAISNFALRVSWSQPAVTNGKITGYYIYLNGRRFTTNSDKPGSYILTDLMPYTIYRIQVEVCTVFDCTRSGEILQTTTEALPSGVVKPQTEAVSPTAVNITWSQPQKENGIILRYNLYRRTIVPCSSVPPTTINPELTKCSYIECSIHERVCGSLCYSGPKVCCDGIVYDSRDNFECCGTSYLYKPSQNSLCCGKQFFEKKDNFKCCGHRYVKVLAGQTCCVDPLEDRVTVGIGDSCCKAIPYLRNTSQICCQGKLYAKFDQLCCGGKIFKGNKTCCGDHVTGSAYEVKPGFSCCSQDYSLSDRSLCCTSDTGHQQVYLYNTAKEKDFSNDICCGLSRISKGLGCCNYRGFNPYIEECADFSDMLSGCGTGKICPLSNTNSSFCDRCNFDKSSSYCGSWVGKATKSVAVVTETPTGDCSIAEDVVYSGLELAYFDTSLQAFSVYEYSIEVVNSAGGTQSSYTSIRTLPSPPTGVKPPKAMIDSTQMYVVELTWTIPTFPNGEITHYILNRNGLELYRGLQDKFTDDNSVLPFKSYEYVLSVCNIAGCTDSSKVYVATAEGIPENIDPPIIVKVSSRSVDLKWAPPSKPNGIITQYRIIFSNGSDISTMLLSINIKGLQPYTNYTLYLEVCTAVGCAQSTKVNVTTDDDLPEGIFPPRIVALSSTSVLVFWDPPRKINGLLKFYSLMRISALGPKNVYQGNDLSCYDHGLSPGGKYQYYLIVGTSTGKTSSSLKSVSMPTGMLNNIPPLQTVTVQSSSQIFIEWEPIITSQGTIDQYGVILNAGQQNQIEKRVGLNFSTVVTGLRPYFEYDVRLLACLAGGPNACGIGPGTKVRTLEAPPTDQEVPILSATAPDGVTVRWRPPLHPNGKILQYLIYYREVGSEVEYLINVVSSQTTQIQHVGQDLKPYTQYQYKVVAGNKKGDVASPWGLVRTLEALPTGLKRPVVNATSAFGFAIRWDPPANPNGVLLQYRVMYRRLAVNPIDTEQQVLPVSANTNMAYVSGLEPYSNYEVFLEVENTVGNTSSDKVIVQTDQSSPSHMPSLRVEKITSGTAVILRWDPPLQPHGVISVYRLYEEDSTLAIYQGLNQEYEMRRLQPFTMYSVQIEACTTAGCTKGTPQRFVTAEILPANQPSPKPAEVNATWVVISWTRPLNPNGEIVQYQILRRHQSRLMKRELSEPAVVYSTNDTNAVTFEFMDTSLQPYTEYQYSVRTINSIGSVQSEWMTVFTEQSPPQDVLSPVVKIIPSDIHSLMITWSVPTNPNGVIQSYQLQRNTSVPLSFTVKDKMEYIDKNLLPYTWYGYTITVCTAGGCTTSPPTVIRTLESSPVQVPSPTLQAVNSTAIRANWPNLNSDKGEITEYRLELDGQVVYSGLETTHIQAGLIPFYQYSFSLQACTRGGCTRSGQVTGRPLDDVPDELSAPVLNVLSSQSVEVTWKPPSSPHGIITSYDVRRDGVLIYTQSLAITGSLITVYTDYGLTPGTTYSYTVIAWNRRGSVESPITKATTYSASPSGLGAPKLIPLSATTVQATWSAPVKPNGLIKNYTLLQEGNIIYTGGPSIFSYIVPGLKFWTEYTFRVQACTVRGCELSSSTSVRTLESAPSDQQPPSLIALADDSGAHAGVLIRWNPPLVPNGVITKYRVYRRKVILEQIGMSYTEQVSVYNGTMTRTNDFNTGPYTSYQYMVMSINSVGGAESQWADIKTREAPPTGLLPPLLMDATMTSFTVQLFTPSSANGVLNMYHVVVNGTVRSSGKKLVQTVGTDTALQPYTVYSVHVQACTAGGCSDSPAITAQTRPSKPQGQGTVQISFANSTNLHLKWNYPSQPNGDIIKFVLNQRTSCPLTFQPFIQTCVVGESIRIIEGLLLEKHLSNLLPYTAYDFQIISQNQAGSVDTDVWSRAVTLQSSPVYVRFPLTIQNGTQIEIDWTNSFELNGQLREFILMVNRRVVFKGVSFISSVEEENGKMLFTVTVVTEVGQASTPEITLNSQTGGRTFVTSQDSAAFYEEIWFIVLMILIGLLLIFVTIAVCLRCSRSSRPYIRERSPLSSRPQKRRDPSFLFEESSSSVFETELSGQPYRDTRDSEDLYERRTGISNPTVIRRHDYDSSSTIEDDEDFINDEDFFWQKNFDSGMFEDMASTGQSYSIAKSHSGFTDSHL